MQTASQVTEKLLIAEMDGNSEKSVLTLILWTLKQSKYLLIYDIDLKTALNSFNTFQKAPH